MSYFDYNASAPLLAVVEKQVGEWLELYPVPSNTCSREGRRARSLLEQARLSVAQFLGATPQEIIFTSSATEANNLALSGYLNFLIHEYGRAPEQLHLITSPLEHSSVRGVVEYWQSLGVQVTYLPVNSRGRVDPQDLARAIQPSTVLVSVMLANHILGSIQPIGQLARICKEHHLPLHCDAVQALGKLEVDWKKLGGVMLSFSGHKVGACKGVGVLLLRQTLRILPLMHGSAQEHGLRPGTENLPAILSLAAVVDYLSPGRLRQRLRRLQLLRQRLARGLSSVKGLKVLTPARHALPNTLTFIIPGVEASSVAMELATQGITVAAPTVSESFHPHPALRALGLNPEQALQVLRLSLGPENTVSEIERFLKILPRTIAVCRQL